jgi:hypothetical protein
MASLPVLNAADPTTIPEKVYDRVWVEEVIIKAPDPNGEVNGEVKLHKYGMIDGVAELDPNGGDWIVVQNMLEKSDEDGDLQTAMGAIINYVAKLGIENNIVDTP